MAMAPSCEVISRARGGPWELGPGTYMFVLQQETKPTEGAPLSNHVYQLTADQPYQNGWSMSGKRWQEPARLLAHVSH